MAGITSFGSSFKSSPSLEEIGFSSFHRVDTDFFESTVGTVQGTIADFAIDTEQIETLKVNRLITGTIYSQTVTLAVTPGEGDTFINAGTTGFDDTTNGFILGIDDSDSDKVKFRIGDATQYLDWNITAENTLTIVGSISVSEGGVVGGWTVGATTLYVDTDIFLDAGNKSISINDTTFGNQGIQLQYNSGTPRMYVGDGADQFFEFNGTSSTTNNTGLAFQDAFGDGSDGDVVISSNTTLTTDMYYDNLTIDATFTLNTANYRVFVKDTLTVNGTIAVVGTSGTNGSNGGNGVIPGGVGAGGAGGSAGATPAAGFFQVGSNGQAGQSGGTGSSNYNSSGTNGGNGGAGTTKTLSLGVNGVVGLAGGDSGGGSGDTGNSGGTAGSAGTVTAPTNNIRSLPELIVFRDYTSSAPTKLNTSGGPGGSGGGGGGGTGGTDSRGGGGGGSGGSGGSGGTMLISAAKITIGAAGIITTAGGTGGNGGNGGNGAVSGGSFAGGGGGGSGGSGGSGGVMLLVYKVLTNSGSITVAAGSGGTGGTAGTDVGSTTVAASNGSNGNNGTAGTKIEIPI